MQPHALASYDLWKMMTALAEPPPPVTRHAPPATASASRLAVSALFFLNGALMGGWVSRIPAIHAALGLTDTVFGLALLTMAGGALVAMPLAGRWSERLGSHRVSRALALVYAAMLPMLALAPNVWTFILALFVFGMGHGGLDVAMNAQAVEIQKRAGRSIMSSVHALFSVGGLAGAASGGLLAAWGLAPLTHFTLIAVLLTALTALTWPALVDDRSADRPAAHQPVFALPTAALAALGALAFCAMVGEGAMADWSAIYLRRILHTSEGFATVGYAAFSITMAATRLLGDGVAMRLGPVRTVRLGGTLAAAGLCLVLIHPQPFLALAGFACIGMGFATVVPLAFSAAGRTKGVSAGVALSSVTTLGYLGFLLGPPIIGFAADYVGLRHAMLGLVVTSGLIVALARRVGA